jgi:hypothetical protein
MYASKLEVPQAKFPLSKKSFSSVRYPDVPIQPSSQPYSKPLVDWFAGRIEDPVRRLRFLQAVAPPPELVSARRARVARLIVPAFLTLTMTALCLVQAGGHLRPVPKTLPPVLLPRSAGTRPLNNVWLVEKTDGSEVYSNGLRIDTHSSVSNRPRSYLAFPLKGTAPAHRTEPAGIVFHATQSRQAPFEADQNHLLRKIGESLLESVRRKRAYHYLIDRFGRVYRVVVENDSANHAGNSVWSDFRWFYLNLNQSFLGIAIEAWSHPGQEEPEMSPAQLRAAAMLIEMLRNRYQIAAENCVAHAQVSVNPSNMQVGYHTDWASGFPFEQVGLPDNYAQPLPALWAFGFESNPDYVQWAGHRLGLALESSESQVGAAAEQAGLSVRAYRKSLQNHYREWLARVRRANSAESDDSE